MKNKSLLPAYFDKIYADADDPWGFANREYELHKYLDTLMHLPRRYYATAFEPGCSIGVLSGMLAARVGNLLSVDVSERALQQARTRNADKKNIFFEMMQFPVQAPDSTFDLIVAV